MLTVIEYNQIYAFWRKKFKAYTDTHLDNLRHTCSSARLEKIAILWRVLKDEINARMPERGGEAELLEPLIGYDL